MLAKSAPEDMDPSRIGDQQGHPVIRTLYDHTEEVAYLEFHPKEQILASASRDCTVKLFDISKASVKKAHKVFTVTLIINEFLSHVNHGGLLIVGCRRNTLPFVPSFW